MRKEVVYAVAAGGLFGLIVAYGIFRANIALQDRSSNSTVVEDDSEGAQGLEVAIASHVDKEVVTSSPVTVEGLTLPNTWVMVSHNSADSLALSNELGEFSQEVELDGGLNMLTITSIKQSGETATATLSLVYSTEFGEAPEESENEATSGANIEQFVIEKLEELKNKPIAFIGTVTDLLSESVQIKDEDDQIQQVAISDQTTYADITDKLEEIDFGDIAIGDYVLSLGFADENGVLSARRVLVANAPEGEVSRIDIGTFGFDEDDNELLIYPQTNEATPLTFSSDLTVYDQGQDEIRLSQVDKDANIIVVSEEGEEGFEVRTIFVVSSQVN